MSTTPAPTMVEQPVFLKKTHELQTLLRRVKEGSAKAVGVLIETMDDNKTDPKLRATIALGLIDLEIKITDQMNKDQMARQIAEIKVKGLSTPLAPEDKVLPPKTDFTAIQEV